MRPGDRETVPTVAEVVRDAAVICDPDAAHTAVTARVERAEDDDRPATAVEDLAGGLLETVEAVDPEDPAGLATVAAAAWLSTNPDQAGDGEHVLREGVRLAYRGTPPAPLAEWLVEREVYP
jgi:hypothetical protein